MNETSIKNAKKIYIETGRLNRNLINKEVAISWYKCKLQNIKLEDSIKVTGMIINNYFDNKFISFIDSIVPMNYQYILVNINLQKCSSRIDDPMLINMDSIDDLAIGTNGGYITYKTLSNQTISLDEHYLDCLTLYHTSGIMINNNDKLQGVLMLLSEIKPNEYDLIRIKEKLMNYNNRVDVDVLNRNSDLNRDTHIELSDFFAYPGDYFQLFEKTIEKLQQGTLPILIKGDKGSGKSTLGLYFALKKGINYLNLNLNDITKEHQKTAINNALFQNETVIVDNLQEISYDALALLTVYNDEIIAYITKEKSSKYKCLNLILTIDYTTFLTIKNTSKGKLIDKLTSKLIVSTVNLVNTDVFHDDPTLIEAILHRNHIKGNDIVKTKLKYLSTKVSFKEIQNSIEISIVKGNLDSNNMLFDIPVEIQEKIETLEEYEKKYVLNVYHMLDKNMTATSDALNIGRSTLYRKLEKYQNDTKL